jgi:hypothetical protein
MNKEIGVAKSIGYVISGLPYSPEVNFTRSYNLFQTMQ